MEEEGNAREDRRPNGDGGGAVATPENSDGDAGSSRDDGTRSAKANNANGGSVVAVGGDAGSSARKEEGEEGASDVMKEKKDDDDDGDDDDDALARMMAFQEEQQGGGGGDPASSSRTEGEAAAAGGGGAGGGGARPDPNVAFLGGGGDEVAPALVDDANADADGADFVHPNLNNPAAVALRRRQALQEAARLGLIVDNPEDDARWRDRPYLLRKLRSIFSPLFSSSSFGYTNLSLLAASGLLLHTLRTREQFYLALVYLQSSKLAYILLGNAVVALAVSTFGFVTRLFLDGGLRPNERDAIGEHMRWDVTETCLALTIFRSELDVVTAVMFLSLVILKCLHWSVELRGGHLRMTEEVFVYPEEDEEDDEVAADGDDANAAARRASKPWHRRIPRLRLSHVRYYALVNILLLVDVLAVAQCALSVATNGPSVEILFGFESAILLVSGLSALGSYHLHVVDGIMGAVHHVAEGEHHRVPVGGMAEADEDGQRGGEDRGGDATDGQQDQEREGGENAAGEDADADGRPPATRTKTFAKMLVERVANPWRDRRATLSFAIELMAQAAKFIFYVIFFAIVFTYYGMPINIFREVYVSFQQLRRRLTAFNTYRRLTHDMDKRFESIEDEEELDRLGRTCIICRDAMDTLGGCKKLPGCGHAFHAHCLREWLVQQQTCPTCRADIAANEARRKKQLEREAAAAAAAATAAEGTGVDAIAEEAAGGASDDAAQAANAPTATGSTTETGGEPVEAAGADGAVAARSESQQQPSTSTPVPTEGDGDALPEGWTRHVDARSGRTYYFNKELRRSSWDKPTALIAESKPSAGTPMEDSLHPNSESSSSVTDNGRDLMTLTDRISSNQFPCLYRVNVPSGAPVFSQISQVTAPPMRTIPCGKLILCTAIEFWSVPSEAMLHIPEGYMRYKDAERFLMLRNDV